MGDTSETQKAPAAEPSKPLGADESSPATPTRAEEVPTLSIPGDSVSGIPAETQAGRRSEPQSQHLGDDDPTPPATPRALEKSVRTRLSLGAWLMEPDA